MLGFLASTQPTGNAITPIDIEEGFGKGLLDKLVEEDCLYKLILSFWDYYVFKY